MSDSFRFLDLPVELQLNVLEQSVSEFSIVVQFEPSEHPIGEWHVERYRAAGRQAVKNLLWLPRSLRSRLRQALISRFNGTLQYHPDIFKDGRTNFDWRHSGLPWAAVRVLNYFNPGISPRFGDCSTSISLALENLTGLQGICHQVVLHPRDRSMDGISRRCLDDNASSDHSLVQDIRSYLLARGGKELEDLQWGGVNLALVVVFGRTSLMLLDGVILEDRQLTITRIGKWVVEQGRSVEIYRKLVTGAS